MPWWISFFPIFMSLLSFSMFLGDVRRKNSKGEMILTRVGVAFLVFGFLGLIGSGFVVYNSHVGDRESSDREKKVLAEVLSLRNQNHDLQKKIEIQSEKNQELINEQKLLVEGNRSLANKVTSLSELVASQSSRIVELSNTNQEISEKNSLIEQQAKRIEEDSRQAKEYAAIQARHAARIREIEEERRDYEEDCKFAKTYLSERTARMVYKCF